MLLAPSLSISVSLLVFPIATWKWLQKEMTLATLKTDAGTSPTQSPVAATRIWKRTVAWLCAPSITHTDTYRLAHIGAVTTKQSHIAHVSLGLLPLAPLLRSATKHALNFLITPGYKSADARVRTQIRLWLRLPHTHTYKQTIYVLCLPPALESARTVVRCRHLHRSYVN